MTLLKVYEEWERNEKSENWCKENFINYKAL